MHNEIFELHPLTAEYLKRRHIFYNYEKTFDTASGKMRPDFTAFQTIYEVANAYTQYSQLFDKLRQCFKYLENITYIKKVILVLPNDVQLHVPVISPKITNLFIEYRDQTFCSYNDWSSQTVHPYDVDNRINYDFIVNAIRYERCTDAEKDALGFSGV